MWNFLDRLFRKNSRKSAGSSPLAGGEPWEWNAQAFVPAPTSDPLDHINTEIAFGRVEAGLTALHALIAAEPRHADAYISRSYAYLSLYRLKEAEADASHAIQLGTRHPNAWNNRARVRTLQWRIEEALADYAAADALDGHRLINLTGLGYLWIQTGEYDKAEAIASELAEFDEGGQTHHALRANIRRQQGELQEALNEADLGLRDKPLDTDLYSLRIHVLCMMREFNAARSKLEVLEKLDAQSAMFTSCRAMVAMYSGDLQAAIELAGQQLSRTPADFTSYFVCHAALAESNMHLQALELSSHAMSQPVLMPEAGLDKLRSLFWLGRVEESQHLLDRLLSEYPHHPQVRLWHADRCVAGGRESEARQVTADLYRQFPHVSDAWFEHALTCLRGWRYQEAIQCAEQNVQRSYAIRALWVRAFALKSLGNTTESLDHAERALRQTLDGEPPAFGLLFRLLSLARGHAVLAYCHSDPQARSLHVAQATNSIQQLTRIAPTWAALMVHDPLLAEVRHTLSSSDVQS